MTTHQEKQSLKRRYLTHMHRNTKCHCFSALFLIFLLSAIVLSAHDFLQGDTDFSDRDSEFVIAADMITYSREQFDLIKEEVDSSLFFEEGIIFSYQWKDNRNEDILTPENLQIFCQVEQLVFRQSSFAFEKCNASSLADSETCVEAGLLSVTATVYRTYNSSFNFEDCYLLPDYVIANFSVGFYAALQNDDASPFRFFANSITQTTMTRSVINIGNNNEETAEDKVLDVEEDLFDFFGMENEPFNSAYRSPATIGNIEVIFFNEALFESEFERLLPSDFVLAFGSMMFLAVWMGIYTRSLFLTVTCTFYILISIPTAMFVYKMVFGLLYFDFFHILVIFIILGIGADGTFVVIDAYKQSRFLMDDELERLIYSWSRATSTVFSTSFTTCVAFSVTGFTTLIPLSTFGIFAALTIATNFVFVCTIVQSTVVNWERWFVKNIEEFKTQEENKKEMSNEETLAALIDRHNKYFEIYYVPFVLKYRRTLTLMGFTVGILGMVGVAQVSQLTEPELFFPEDHSLANYVEDIALEFLSGEEDEFALLTVFWGVDSIERDIAARYAGDIDNFDDEVTFAPNFDISDYQAQQAIITACELIENHTCSLEVCQGFTTLDLPETPTYRGTCTMRDFHDWYNFSEALPTINRTLLNSRLMLFLEEKPEYIPHIGFVNGEVEFVSIEYRLTLPLLVAGDGVQEYIDILDDLVKVYDALAPSTAKPINYAADRFSDYALEIALVDTVTRGLIITFPIVFVVLLIASGNWVLAAISVVAIAFIVITVMGTVFGLLGWELGVAESIVSIMIVGLSVDYAIHLGHMYTVGGKTEGFHSREDKFHYSILTMGPTVLAGGVTTLGAGIFLFAAQITFFGKMGVLLTLTVCCSLFYSLVFLMAFVVWCGPEGKFANLECNFPTKK